MISARFTAPGMALLLMGVGSPNSQVFRYRPPDGTSFTLTLHRHRVQRFPGKPVLNFDGTTVTRETVHRTGQGYRVVKTLLKDTTLRNGKPLSGAYMKGAAGIPITYFVDIEGRLLRVLGQDRFVSGILNAYRAEGKSEKDLKRYQRYEENRFQDLVREWNTQRIVGRKAAVGSMWDTRENFYVPLATSAGLVPCHSQYRVMNAVSVGKTKCVTVRHTLSADPIPLQEFLRRRINLKRYPRAASDPWSLVARKDEDFVIDPMTSLVYSGRFKKVFSFKLDPQSPGGMAFTLSEEETMSYQYP